MTDAMTTPEQIAEALQWLENTSNGIYDGRYNDRDCAAILIPIVRAFGVLEGLVGNDDVDEVTLCINASGRLAIYIDDDSPICAPDLLAAIREANKND